MNCFHFWQQSSHVPKNQNSYSTRNTNKQQINGKKKCLCTMTFYDSSPLLPPLFTTIPYCSFPEEESCLYPFFFLLPLGMMMSPGRHPDERQRSHHLVAHSMEWQPFPGTSDPKWSRWCWLKRSSAWGIRTEGEGWECGRIKQANIRKNHNALCYSFLFLLSDTCHVQPASAL